METRVTSGSSHATVRAHLARRDRENDPAKSNITWFVRSHRSLKQSSFDFLQQKLIWGQRVYPCPLDTTLHLHYPNRSGHTLGLRLANSLNPALCSRFRSLDSSRDFGRRTL